MAAEEDHSAAGEPIADIDTATGEASAMNSEAAFSLNNRATGAVFAADAAEESSEASSSASADRTATLENPAAAVGTAEEDSWQSEETSPRSRRPRPASGVAETTGMGKAVTAATATAGTATAPLSQEEEERTVAWLSLGKQAAESRCRELETELAEARRELTKQETSVHIAHQKIRHLEAENRGLLAAAEFREKEAASTQEKVDLAHERAHAHEKALASALEQLSDSGVSQSRKLAELADVAEELERTKAALDQAEGLVFQQRQEADERRSDDDRRRAAMDALRQKLSQVERKNTELLAKQAAGRLAKKMRGNFGRSSTFCASFCGCFRGRPVYRRVASPTPLPGPSGVASESPWLA